MAYRAPTWLTIAVGPCAIGASSPVLGDRSCDWLYAGPLGNKPLRRQLTTPNPYGDRIYGDRIYGDRIYGDRIYGDRIYGDSIIESDPLHRAARDYQRRVHLNQGAALSATPVH